MNVLQINVTLNVGSTGKIAHEIGVSILSNGYNSTIAYGRDARQSNSKSIKIGNKYDQGIHLAGTRILDLHGLCSRSATNKLCDHIRNTNYDIIHLHNIHGYYLHYEILFSCFKEINIPVIWTLHDCWAFTGHCAYFTHIGCDKWKSECHKCPLKSTYPASYGVDRSLSNFRSKKNAFTSVNSLHLVTVSQWLKELVGSSFLNVHTVDSIYNGINTNVFKPKSESNHEAIKKKYNIRRPYLLGVSNVWTDRKGLNDFILLRERLGAHLDIVLVGLSDAQIEILPRGIVGIARTDDQDSLATIYSGAEVFINFSILETFGLVTAEAMSSGTPTIVYNATASPELVEEGTGYVVEVGDMEETLKCIDKILSEDNEVRSNRCRKSALRRFDMTKQNQKYIELYEGLVQPK